jgi:hypothetical protein
MEVRMRYRAGYTFLALLVAGCAARAERPTFFAGTGTVDSSLDCAQEVLEDDGFIITRDDDEGRLSADRGRNWVYVTVIPQQPLIHHIQVTSTRDSRESAQEIAVRCRE